MSYYKQITIKSKPIKLKSHLYFTHLFINPNHTSGKRRCRIELAWQTYGRKNFLWLKIEIFTGKLNYFRFGEGVVTLDRVQMGVCTMKQLQHTEDIFSLSCFPALTASTRIRHHKKPVKNLISLCFFHELWEKNHSMSRKPNPLFSNLNMLTLGSKITYSGVTKLH